jgi:hypothetical protein
VGGEFQGESEMTMRYTAVFEWPEEQAPIVRRGDKWKGGDLCEVKFCDAIDELRRLREAAQNYCDNYLRDELDEPYWCHDDKRHDAVVALWDALLVRQNPVDGP